MMDSKALEAAKALIEKASRTARRRDAKTTAGRSRLIKQEHEAIKRVLAAAGVDTKGLDAQAADRWKARKELAEQTYQKAVAASGAAAKRLAKLTPANPSLAFPTNVILDRVTFIRSFSGGGVVLDSDVVPNDSWARYRLDEDAGYTEERGAGRLSFFTLWQNTRNEPVVVEAGARLKVNAYVSVEAEWMGVAAWSTSGADARATVRARTTVYGMGANNVKSVVHDQILGDASAAGGFFGDDDYTTIEFNDFLTGSGFHVPAQGFILIEVELVTEWYLEVGHLRLDAESGDFRVSVPHLILRVT